ncbi:hypothetical protein [Streptomyces sp. NPDC058291]|uniref:hypothetical protein n=1 Tax=Streptomyces sp. NPDC058291 TaxID=3346427 RepID=UPI0036E894B4
MGTAKSAAPNLGDEQWSQLLTFSAGGEGERRQADGDPHSNILMIVSGSPGLMEAHLDKARTTR